MTAPAAAPFWRLRVLDAVTSTSDLCRALAVAGEPEGTAILAHRQTQGRGSRGRDWVSPAGNLALSVLLRPPQPARDAGQWSLLAAVAVIEALAPFLPAPDALAVKWPNDVLLHGRKLAGILIDSSAAAGSGPDGMLEWLVIGIGINLAYAPAVPGRPTACIADAAPAPAAEDAAAALLARLDHWRARWAGEGFAPIRAAWLRHGPVPDAPVTLRVGGQTLEGTFAGLDDQGSLRLRSGDRVRAFAAGEVLLP
jgi:BirA family biotin operon repressor/biotin-[acetyl-CoA-carboxylase] ligase